MSRRAMTLVVGAVAGVALLVGVRVAMNDNEAAGAAADTGSVAARTSWGEPNLTGVWKGETLGASSGA